MSSSSPAQSAADAGDPIRRRNWAGEPTMLLGEDRDGFNELLAQVQRALAPRDALEDMWMRDVVDLAWDVLRLRRMKANLLRLRAREGVESLIWSRVRNAPKVASQWSKRDPAAISQVDAALKSAGLSMDTVMAVALQKNMGETERLDAMIANAEKRRGIALLELERYRASFAENLREALGNAEISDVSAGPLGPQPVEKAD